MHSPKVWWIEQKSERSFLARIKQLTSCYYCTRFSSFCSLGSRSERRCVTTPDWNTTYNGFPRLKRNRIINFFAHLTFSNLPVCRMAEPRSIAAVSQAGQLEMFLKLPILTEILSRILLFLDSTSFQIVVSVVSRLSKNIYFCFSSFFRKSFYDKAQMGETTDRMIIWLSSSSSSCRESLRIEQLPQLLLRFRTSCRCRCCCYTLLCHFAVSFWLLVRSA